MPSNNNPTPKTFNHCSNAFFSTSCSDASSQTNPTSSNSTTFARSALSASTFKCSECARILVNERELKKHFEDDHKLSIDLKKLQDDSEEDQTTRFVRSVNLDGNYLE